MNSSVKSVVAVVATATGLAAFGKDQSFYNVCDIAGAAIDADTTQVYFNSRTDSAAFTLSADTTIPCKVGVSSGITCFDFTDGNHTLTIDDTLWVTLNNNTDVRMKGGIWDFSTTGVFYTGYYGSSNYSGQKLLVDGTTIRRIGTLLLGGENTQVVLTNGAVITTSADVGVCLATPGSIASTHATNVSVVVARGSRLESYSTVFSDSNSSGGPGLAGNRVLVTGSGSYLGPIIGRTQRLYHGYRTGGNAIRYEKGATARYYETWVGYHANAKSNLLVIAEGAAYTNTSAAGIGMVVGSDYNRIEVLDGGILNQTMYNDFSVGGGGCFNELLVSNAIVENAKNFIVGNAAGSSGNRMRITGRSSRLSFPSEFPTLFGCGQGNEWVVDDCDIDAKSNPIPGQSGKDWRIYFSGTSSKPNINASTNNTLRIDNAARLRSYQLIFPLASEGNLAVVANCSTLDVSNVTTIRGHGNILAVSNATMRLAGITIGSEADDASGFVESGNAIVFQGKTPVLSTYSGAADLKVYDGGILRFEIPADGYDTTTPIPIRTYNTYIYNGTVEFAGLENLTQNMKERVVTYQLTNAGFRMYDENKVENGDEQLAEITKTLPPGCEVYRNSSTLYLMLKVKAASKGLVLILR